MMRVSTPIERTRWRVVMCETRSAIPALMACLVTDVLTPYVLLAGTLGSLHVQLPAWVGPLEAPAI
jgi:hypothetical protein